MIYLKYPKLRSMEITPNSLFDRDAFFFLENNLRVNNTDFDDMCIIYTVYVV